MDILLFHWPRLYIVTCNILVWLHILAGLLHEFLSFESRQALQAPSKEGVTSNEHLVRKLLNHRYTWRYIFLYLLCLLFV